MAICKWTGASGKTYEYDIYNWETTWNDVAGNYIFAKETSPGTWEAVYIGETESFKTRLTNQHERLSCAKRNGFTHIHAHTNSSQQARLAEQDDLIENCDPPCNRK